MSRFVSFSDMLMSRLFSFSDILMSRFFFSDNLMSRFFFADTLMSRFFSQVIVVGDAGVGKTSLIHQLTRKKFNQQVYIS